VSAFMFVGHLALGFAAKRATPRVSLAVLLTASELADVLWPFFLALGLEQVRIAPGITAFTPLDFVSYPYSHSLVMLVVWGIMFGAIYRAVTSRNGPPPLRFGEARRSLGKGGPPPLRFGEARRSLGEGGRVFIVLAALVVSHWVLDWITHRPDMPIYPGGPTYGLGLWNSVPATMIVEGTMFAAGLWMYVRTTRARDRIGRWGFAALIALLVVVYAANATASPPPSVNAIIVGATIGAAIMTVSSWWVDDHREFVGVRAGEERRGREGRNA
jgi:hypothetical protein